MNGKAKLYRRMLAVIKGQCLDPVKILSKYIDQRTDTQERSLCGSRIITMGLWEAFCQEKKKRGYVWLELMF